MYVAVVPNRNSPPGILLREGLRENARVRNLILANIPHWPAPQTDAIRLVLKGKSPPAAPLPWFAELRRPVATD